MSVTVADFVIQFGRHKGSSLREVPKPYLEWCLESGAGGANAYAAIAAYLGVYVPFEQQKTVKGQPTKPAAQKKQKPQMGERYDCSHMHNPNADWPDKQEWDGITAPWLDQGGELDAEFRGMFG